MAQEEYIERVLSTPILSLPLALPSGGTSSLVLRPFLNSDAPAVAAAANHLAVWRNLTDSFPHPYTLESAQSWITLQQDVEKTWKSTVSPSSAAAKSEPEQQRPESRIPSNYLITLDDEPIGSIGLVFQADIECRTAELGYWLTPAYWKKGVMSTIVPVFLEWTFKTFPYVVRVEAKVYSWNQGSWRVCEKAGMERESVMRKSAWKEGRLGDVLLYVKLREDVGDEKYEAFEE